jgi:type II secretory pathway predicted ATPase ExeA
VELLAQQHEILQTLKVHCQQGGLCLVLGEPGTGKSVVRNAIRAHDPKRLVAPLIQRSLHSYFNILRILCQACSVETDRNDFHCERQLIDYAVKTNREGKMLVPIIDDAHLLDIGALRKLRLLMEEFPKNHNLVLVGQPSLLSSLHLSTNADIKSRVTYSVAMARLNPDQMRQFILEQFDRVRLGHNVLGEEALELIVRSSEGILRRARNLCLGALVEAVAQKTRTVELKQVNAVLIQPHWRKPSHDMDQS